MDVEIFIPAENDTTWDSSVAKSICNTCPVAVNCVDCAVTSKSKEFGVWFFEQDVHRRLQRFRRVASTYDDTITELALELSSGEVYA